MTRAAGPVSVALPGPWWTLLTYLAPPCERGVRVRVPVGKGTRVGLVVSNDTSREADAYDGPIREVAEVIDARSLLPDTTLSLLRWFCDTYLCSMGTAMKTLLPANFLGGGLLPAGEASAPVPQPPLPLPSDPAGAGATFLYEPIDARRWARYAELLADGRPTLVAFPIHADAKRFAAFLRDISNPDLAERLFLYPRNGAAAEWKAWGRLLQAGQKGGEGSPALVVGGQSAAMAPLPGVSRIIVEDESNPVWRTMRPPIYNVRSLLAKRARLEGASFVLGGRMPSARAYLRLEASGGAPPEKKTPGKRTIFVDAKLAYAPSVKGICETLAVSEPLVRETEAAFSRNAWALWILDRKGYAGEVLCSECDTSIRCPRCGGTMRWEAASDRMRCVACGTNARVPEACPNCSGRLLTARRPGLEALHVLARAAIGDGFPVLSMEGEDGCVPDAASKSPCGLLIGTRVALSACDTLRVGLVAWVDADGEARSHEHDARQRAFGLMWESSWRGLEPESRNLLLQTRRPGRDWQRGLSEGPLGWRTFWRKEMQERREFSMPPCASLVRLEANRSITDALSEALSSAGVEFWVADEESAPKPVFWIRTQRLSQLRNALAPFFHIRLARRGFPSLTVWHE